MADMSLHHVEKIFDSNVHAVSDFNLAIKNKEFIVFVGPSGCGKSTTLRMIAGLEKISAGELHINGKRMNDIPPKDRDIAMVFQNYALYPHMNVYQNMAFSLRLRKFDKQEIDRRVKHAAGILGLEDYLTRKPKALSGGQRQRVALGRAIVRDPKVFLMDEPLSNLDAKLRVQMRAEIIKLHKKLQTTTIYVTHDQTEAMTMATRIVVMKDGVIQQIGTPKEVYNTPSNTFVAGFIGSPSMNILSAFFDGEDLIIGDKSLPLPANIKEALKEQGFTGSEILFGIRPEDIWKKDREQMSENYPCLSLQVEVVELHGAESILYHTLGSQKLIARFPALNTIQMGDTMEVVLNMDNAHFFHVDSEEKIQLNMEGPPRGNKHPISAGIK
ncbi:ABC transporter ATP-binding protein [Salibacterium aidingense]|uniref:ABC transporter ATP-binding protein n=1 Tax=Salibacterium aidingense TaxID=384933 RepID=UPI003BE22524